MKFIKALLLGSSALTAWAQAEVVDLGCHGSSCYTLYNGADAQPERAARKVCERNGGHLVAIDDRNEFKYLAKKIECPVWVDSWEGNDYGDTCVVLWPGGAITPNSSEKGCRQPTAFVCERPCDDPVPIQPCDLESSDDGKKSSSDKKSSGKKSSGKKSSGKKSSGKKSSGKKSDKRSDKKTSDKKKGKKRRHNRTSL